MELSDLLGEREKEVEKLKEKNKKCNDALDAMETEYEEMLRTKDPKKGGTGGAPKEHMDSDTREQLCSVEKQNLVEGYSLLLVLRRYEPGFWGTILGAMVTCFSSDNLSQNDSTTKGIIFSNFKNPLLFFSGFLSFWKCFSG